MKYRSGNELRKLFLEYFKQKKHLVESGVSLIPNDDPSLLWINSGVSALKKYFDGSIVLEVPRIVNSQRSLRTNDIENVGVTARHHTMFEMLGNFSIGDYFKKEAIEFAWEFLTSPEWVGMDKEKLYVTIYPEDQETFDIWHNHIGLAEDRIFKLEGNFWEIGNGPCGPNSEIFYDRGEKYDPENIGIDLLAKDLDNDRYIEVWNIVFSQFNAVEDKKRSEYELLPQKNIDTGMGLERLTSLVQEAETNFETDLFMPIIERIKQLSSFPYQDSYKKAYRVIADHIRALTFALADGAMFSNEGRGYVLKRLLRRAERFGLELGIKKPFLYELVDVVVENMSDYYPYLKEKQELIKKIIKIEEEKFQKTLSDGLKLFQEVVLQSENKTISGEQAFKLYDTYGFPIEIVCELSQEAGYLVDMDGFNEYMKKQQELARASFKDDSNMQEQSADLLNFKEKSEFVGYDNLMTSAKIIGLFQNGQQVDVLKGEGEVIFDKTCFYAQSGGQVSDLGEMIVADKAIEVLSVKKAPNNQHLHLVDVNELKVGDQVELVVNRNHRQLVERNHSATHILHKVLSDVVGSHIAQAGSLVTSEYLRFDFNHYEKLSDNQLKEIETKVNEIIIQGLDVQTQLMDLEQAKEKGAKALFSEKYDQEVRVISIGDFSLELCGGNHINNSAQIGLFVIEREESVGSGIRRIIARTSKEALAYLKNYEDQINDISKLLKEKNKEQVVDKVERLVTSYDELKKENELLNLEIQKSKVSSVEEYEMIDNKKVFLLSIDADVKMMKELIDNLKNEHQDAVVILFNNDDKISYVVGVSKDIIDDKVNAKSIAQLINENFEGRGGGKAEMAQGGINKMLDLNEMKGLLKDYLS